MSSSNPPLNFSRKHRILVRQVWRRTTSLPQSPPQSQNVSPPLPPRVANSQPLPPPSQNPLRDQMVNQLHHISYLLETNLQNATNVYSQAPPSSQSPSPPLIHPATLDQVNFYSGFCHCCVYTQNQFHSLRDELNFIKFPLPRPLARVNAPPNNVSPTSPLSPRQI
ncbi:hypothetical protein Tco_0047682 [Tanacetum coccineum]